MNAKDRALAEVNLLNEERLLAQHREDMREAVKLAAWHQVEIDLAVQRIQKLRKAVA